MSTMAQQTKSRAVTALMNAAHQASNARHIWLCYIGTHMRYVYIYIYMHINDHICI